jgi:hypothetical protein
MKTVLDATIVFVSVDVSVGSAEVGLMGMIGVVLKCVKEDTT